MLPAGDDGGVGKAQPRERHTHARQLLRHQRAQAQKAAVFLHCDYTGGLRCRAPDRLAVQGLYAEHVQHPARYALLTERIRGRRRGGDHVAAGDDRHVVARPGQQRAVFREVGAAGRIDLGRGAAPHPHVGGQAVGGQTTGERTRGLRVRRHIHAQTGQDAQRRYVVHGVVSEAQRAVAHPAAYAYELYVAAGVADVHLDLLHAPRGEEGGGGQDEGTHPAGGEARRHGHQILLRYPQLYELPRQAPGKT